MKIALSGNVSSMWSYSIAIRDFAVALEEVGHDVLLLPDEYLNGMPLLDYRVKRMVEKSRADLKERIFIRMAEGNNQHYGGWGRGRIAMTMLETTGLPPAWAEQLNLQDQVWTCSTWGKQVFEDSGVTRPVHVVPLSVNDKIFRPDVDPVEFGVEPGTFVFFINSSFGSRHNVEAALAAYYQEFTEKDKVLLVYHGNMCQHIERSGSTLVKYLKHSGIIKSETDPRPRLYLTRVSGHLPPQYLARIYKTAHLHITTARGHGFNLTSMESMACGTPTAVTNWSAHTDFVTDENGFLIRVRDMVPAFQDFLIENYAGSKWADPLVSDVRRVMREAYEDRYALQCKGEQAYEDFRSKYTWRHSVEKAENALSKLLVWAHSGDA